jgi:hypothetical protein
MAGEKETGLRRINGEGPRKRDNPPLYIIGYDARQVFSGVSGPLFPD